MPEVRRAVPVLPTVLLAPLVALLVACGGPAGAPPTPSASSSTSSAPLAVWPVSSREQAERLQREVDSGHQPWLLDPESVASAYASAVLGWSGAQVRRTGADTVVVHQPGGDRSTTLTLGQPVRGGETGVWVVVATR